MSSLFLDEINSNGNLIDRKYIQQKIIEDENILHHKRAAWRNSEHEERELFFRS